MTQAKPVRRAKATKKKAAKKATKKKTTSKKKGEGLTLDERRDKIRKRYERPVVIYEDDDQLARAPSRFVRLNRLLGGGFKPGAIVEVSGWEDSGKAQPLDTPVLTPFGFTKLGDVQAGDEVIGLDGRPTEVLGIYPQGVKEVYRVETSDGGETECCGEHLWWTQTLYERELGHPGRVRSLAEIQETIRRGQNPNHSIPLSAPVEFTAQDDLIPQQLDPYLLGVLLGDGSLTGASLMIHNSELHVLERVLSLLPEGDEGVVFRGHTGLSMRIVRPEDRLPSTTMGAVRALGLEGKTALDKFVPAPYLMGPITARRNLLLGLMDTDGTVDKPGRPSVSYSTSSEQLCFDVTFLVRSLGGIATVSSRQPRYAYKGELREGKTSYKVVIQFPDGWCPVSSKKHLARWKAPELVRHRRIVEIEPAGERECVCIRVAAPDGLYVTSDFLVTHNTSFTLACAGDIQAQAPRGRDHVVMVNFEIHDDYVWWRTLKLDTSKGRFTQLQPKSLEEGVADLYDLCSTGEVCVGIVDSVYAANSKDSDKLMEAWRNPKKSGQAGAGGIGIEARQWGKAWTAIKGVFKEHGIVVFAVNQVREKPEVGGGPKRKNWSGPKTTTPRGHALKFYAWVRLELSASVLVDEDNNIRRDVDGRRVRIKVIKNKTSPDARGLAHYDLIRGFGFDLTGELIDLALECGAIHHSGGGHYRCGKHKIHGKANLRQWVEGSERVQAILRQVVERWLSKQDVGEEEFSFDEEDD